MRVLHIVATSPWRIVDQESSSTRVTKIENEFDTSSSEEVFTCVASSGRDGNDLGTTPMQDPPLTSFATKEVPKAIAKQTPTITPIVS
jgi:hypothetical protein